MPETRKRHSAIVRICHWTLAISGLLLCFTGIGTMPLYARFFVNELPGLGWSTDLLLQLRLHYLFAGLFSASGCFHLTYHFRRREFALVPQKGDVHESWKTIKAMLLRRPEPSHDKFLAEQRLAYAAFLMISAVLLLSGWLLVYRQLTPGVLPPDLLQLVVLLHLTAGLGFGAAFFLHLLAFLPKGNRPLFAAMFNGKVAADYANQRHPQWK